MTVQEIEAAMQSLSINELAQVRDKAEALYQARWDAQLVIDMESGRLDAWIDEDKQEKRKGKPVRYDTTSRHTAANANTV